MKVVLSLSISTLISIAQGLSNSNHMLYLSGLRQFSIITAKVSSIVECKWNVAPLHSRISLRFWWSKLTYEIIALE